MSSLSETLIWRPGYGPAVTALTAFILLYTAYHFLSEHLLVPARFARRLPADRAEVAAVLARRLAGFLLLGAVPLVMIVTLMPGGPAAYGLAARFSPRAWLLIAGFTLTVIPLALLFSGRPGLRSRYPHIRVRDWTRGLVALNAVGWGLFLLAYEICFRGFLLFPCVRAFGFWPAVIINLALYAGVHLPKGLVETLGALPLGLLLCVCALLFGVWVPFLLHWVLALANDQVALWKNPEFVMRSEAGEAV
jgi:membrane protease YdiL (CAAX protease family)